MIRSATRADLEQLRALFSRANDAPYDLAAVAEEKCFGDGVSGAPTVRVFGDFAGASVTCGKSLRILAVDRANRRRGIGSALLADAESRGASVVAAEAGNYFTPGVWTEDEGTSAFFASRGYVIKAETWNLVADLRNAQGPATSSGGAAAALDRQALERNPAVPLSRTAAPQAWRERVCRPTIAESDRVLAFIEQHFGRIWRFEAAKAFDFDPVRMFITDDMTGFAVHDVNNRGLGFFGPTGVIPSMRGRGLGCALLRASLSDLRELGYEHAIIPWTDALEFYRKCCGAEAAHRFQTFARATV